MRFRLSPDLSGAKLDAVLFRPNEHPDVPFSDGKHNRGGLSNVRKWRGRTLLVADSGYKGKPFIGEVVDDKFVPRVAFCDFVKTNAAGKVKSVGVSLWQNGERLVCEGLRADMMWASRVGFDMEIVLRIPASDTDWQTDALCVLRPDDNLRYDFSKMQRLKLPDALRGTIYAATISPNGKTKNVTRSFPEDNVASVALGVSRSSGKIGLLRLWVKVRNDSPWKNEGEDLNLVFRTGDCIDLRWAADSTANVKRRTPVNGDIRLLITSSGVMRHTFVDHTVPKNQWQTFSSPVGVTEIAKVERIDNIKVAIDKKKDGYELTADIPWSVLGEVGPPVHGSERRMDVGVIFGDADGTCAVRRVYLFDSESGVVADLFSEARVNPSNCGSVKF